MEYVLMGFLKSPKPAPPINEHLLRVKGSLEANEGFETYFCAVNFNIRKFAMVKMLGNEPSQEVE
jgi:hypothetical protein